jgi:hypothetical protein
MAVIEIMRWLVDEELNDYDAYVACPHPWHVSSMWRGHEKAMRWFTEDGLSPHDGSAD